MKKNPEYNVTIETTLLPFLLICLKGKSRNYIKGILKRGQVMVDGVMCKDYARSLHPEQRVEVLPKVPITNGKLGIPIIFEDDDIIVIDKPAGMLSIGTDSERDNTAYHMVSSYIKSGTSKSGRIFIVHRLDRETSGVLLFAKNERTKYTLQDNWNTAAIKRGYVAVVEGKVLTPEGTVKSWLKQTKTLMVYSSGKKDDGKLAITNYRTLQVGDEHSILDISLDTGRKNQIRVHMKDLGHPVVGDKKYGALTDPFGRIGLHASTLTVKHPSTGEKMTFESSIPNAFTQALSLKNNTP